MCVSEQHRIQFIDVQGQGLPVAFPQPLVALEQTAID